MPVVQLRLAGACVLGMHAPPPYPYDPTGMHPYVTALLERIADGHMRTAWGACSAGDPVVLVGDLNAVPGSRPYRRMRSAGLRDPRRWVGVYGLTWPTGGGWPWVPLLRLDHVLIGAAPVRLVQTMRVPDTDHKALVVAIAQGAQE
jgi:endonuclease/exonuclease/phosphatase (EEP) superfamily protein YafD